jgi:hypothetical protein
LARLDMAEAIVASLQIYFAIGLAFAVLFSLFGIARVDEGARFDRGAPIGSVLFRLLVIPATTLLWPIVAWRALIVLRRTRADAHTSSPPPETGS